MRHYRPQPGRCGRPRPSPGSLKDKKRRLALYYKREAIMLSEDGIKSYGIGSWNASRYYTALKDIQDMIRRLEDEIAALEQDHPRRLVGILPRDW